MFEFLYGIGRWLIVIHERMIKNHRKPRWGAMGSLTNVYATACDLLWKCGNRHEHDHESFLRPNKP